MFREHIALAILVLTILADNLSPNHRRLNRIFPTSELRSEFLDLEQKLITHTVPGRESKNEKHFSIKNWIYWCAF